MPLAAAAAADDDAPEPPTFRSLLLPPLPPPADSTAVDIDSVNPLPAAPAMASSLPAAPAIASSGARSNTRRGAHTPRRMHASPPCVAVEEEVTGDGAQSACTRPPRAAYPAVGLIPAAATLTPDDVVDAIIMPPLLPPLLLSRTSSPTANSVYTEATADDDSVVSLVLISPLMPPPPLGLLLPSSPSLPSGAAPVASVSALRPPNKELAPAALSLILESDVPHGAYLIGRVVTATRRGSASSQLTLSGVTPASPNRNADTTSASPSNANNAGARTIAVRGSMKASPRSCASRARLRYPMSKEQDTRAARHCCCCFFGAPALLTPPRGDVDVAADDADAEEGESVPG